MSGPPYPCTTAAGSSSADSTGTSPRSRSATRSPSPPMSSTLDPCGSCSAISRATACAEVITSSGVRRHPELRQMLGHRLRRTQRVVRDVREPHPAVPRRGERLDRVRDGLAARVHHPVQIEQSRVVRLVQRPLAAARPGPAGLAHPHPLLARCSPPIIAHARRPTYHARMNTTGRADHGLRLIPFRGLRYVPERVGSLAAVTSPPYDVVVRPDGLLHLESADPYNIVRLILPQAATPAARNQQAALTLADWLDEGVLAAGPRTRAVRLRAGGRRHPPARPHRRAAPSPNRPRASSCRTRT